VNKKFSEQRLQALLKESGLPGKAAVLYTRDWLESFTKVLEPGSLVVLATKKRWWRTREEKLARQLMKAGHQVMLLPVVR
jgi:spermidine synthase